LHDCYGDSPIHTSARNGSLACIKAMKGSIDISILRMTNNDGYTAQEVANANQQYECERYIDDLMNVLYEKEQIELRTSAARFTQFQGGGGGWGTAQFDQPQLVQGGSFMHGGGGPGFYGSRPGTAGGPQAYGARRPTTAGGGYMDPYNNGNMARNVRHGTQFMEIPSYRPTSAGGGGYQDFGGMLPQIDNYGFSDAQDVWGAFSNPYEETSGWGYGEFNGGGGFDGNNNEYAEGGFGENRPKSPWTLRREQGEMQDWYGEWAKFIDRESAQEFWWNAISGVCQWEMPQAVRDLTQEAYNTDPISEGDREDCEPTKANEGDNEYTNEAEQIRQRSYVLDRIGTWSECQDPVTGDVFYYDNDTGECEWDLPAEMEELREQKKREEEASLKEEAEAEAAKWVLTMREKSQEQGGKAAAAYDAIMEECKWVKTVDDESGKAYYRHKETEETSWEEPEEYKKAATEANQILLDGEGQAQRVEDLEELKSKIKAEAAAQIAEQVKAVISSTEEERERLRKEFEAQIKEQQEQTKFLVDKMAADSEEARKRKEEAILKAKDKGGMVEEQQKITEEKAELLAEHGEELKQLAAVISADRTRQNQKLQEKLQERRRARALKRAQIANLQRESSRASILKVGPTTPGAKTGTSGEQKTPLATPSKTPLATPGGLSKAASSVPSEPVTLLNKACEDILRQAMKTTAQLRGFVGVHLQYLPAKTGKELAKIEFGKTIVPVLWGLFRTFCIMDQRTPLPVTLSKGGFKKFLDDGNLKLSINDREQALKSAYESEQGICFEKFRECLLSVLNLIGCDSETFYREKIVPICVKASLHMETRCKRYQHESKRLATGSVRKLLQLNVAQLKLLYLYYSMVAQKRKSPCEKKTITLQEAMMFSKEFQILAKLCAPKHLTEVFEDMSIRKPGPPASLGNYVIPFNQWVQLLFHAALRFCKIDEEKQKEKNPDNAHKYIIALLTHLDKSGAKSKMKVKGLAPFTTIIPETSKETSETKE